MIENRKNRCDSREAASAIEGVRWLGRMSPDVALRPLFFVLFVYIQIVWYACGMVLYAIVLVCPVVLETSLCRCESSP